MRAIRLCVFPATTGELRRVDGFTDDIGCRDGCFLLYLPRVDLHSISTKKMPGKDRAEFTAGAMGRRCLRKIHVVDFSPELHKTTRKVS